MKPSRDRLYGRESVMQRPCVRFENWSKEFLVLARLRGENPEVVGKPMARSSRGAWCVRHQSVPGYPKPADLCLGKMKPWETGVEV